MILQFARSSKQLRRTQHHLPCVPGDAVLGVPAADLGGSGSPERRASNDGFEARLPFFIWMNGKEMGNLPGMMQ